MATSRRWAAWPMRGTRQFVDDMFWLLGEELGLLAAAATVLLRQG